MSKEKLYDYKKMKMNGAYHHLVRYQGESAYKLHCWDGPAIEPATDECTLKKSWYINGIQLTQEEFDDRIREREGLPFFKQPGFEEERH